MKARRSPAIDLNRQYQSDLQTQQTNESWLGKHKSGFWKEKEKGAELYAKKEKTNGTLRHLQTTIALRGIIQLNLTLFGKRKSRGFRKGNWSEEHDQIIEIT